PQATPPAPGTATTPVSPPHPLIGGEVEVPAAGGIAVQERLRPHAAQPHRPLERPDGVGVALERKPRDDGAGPLEPDRGTLPPVEESTERRLAFCRRLQPATLEHRML